MSLFTAAAVQTTGEPLDLTGNAARIERHVRCAVDDGAKLVVLPELCHTGYTLSPRLSEVSGTLPGASSDFLCGLARELDTTIVTTIAVLADDGGLQNVGLIVSPDGIAATGAKRGLWGGEPELFTPGPPGEHIVADTPLGRVGVAICYEAGFPEVARQLAVDGAEIIALPAAFGAARLHAWKLLTRSRALENGCYLIAANSFGSSGSLAFCGHSTIVDPHGRRLALLADTEGRIVADLDPSVVRDARAAIPYLHDLHRVTGSLG
ncbi:carbon-nitrogen hydrolase family protein [Streptomyces brasiliensis]|uniref:Apolipoprotein N-acyltransferase n=1 Tax=Streptomyces brasiliensis TaxID=1954 RepID=A0A917LCC0_9ACTN|nr:carbon-nitrogen hydrolase family protein [Streptomyces brasiliensis]GGJ59956.1 apolipoprotein N-acyltransferase [Streptomyces brasiliensis]